MAIMEEAKEFSLPVPWGHIAAKAWGSPTNFPVLCTHGILDNAGAFDRLIVHLPKDYYYVSIDLPGHGFSSHFPPGMHLDFFNYILSVRYIVDRLKWKTFYFIGHSLGGQIGTFYSIIYPNQIQKLVLIDGMAPRTFGNRQIIPRLTKVLDSTFKATNERKDNLYTYEDVIYTLKNRRQNCLNTEAAEALFKRSVTQVGDLFKYNRDVRLREYIAPIFHFEQLSSILSNLNTEILLIITSGSYQFLTDNQDEYTYESIQNLVEAFSNIKLFNVVGNHDVHNNNPERLSNEISEYLGRKNINSKL